MVGISNKAGSNKSEHLFVLDLKRFERATNRDRTAPCEVSTQHKQAQTSFCASLLIQGLDNCQDRFEVHLKYLIQELHLEEYETIVFVVIEALLAGPCPAPTPCPDYLKADGT